MDLSILMPARNEMFLSETVEDILKNVRAETEIIVVLDGGWSPTPLRQDSQLHLVYLPEPIGQRAATNLAARISDATYVMKLDAHCAVDEGFDAKLIAAAQTLDDNVTQVPAQYNLHAFDWVCQHCNKRLYQGPTPTACACGTPAYAREMVWNAKRRLNRFYRFDCDLKFQYWGDLKHRPSSEGDVCDTMSCLGAAYFLSRQRFWEIGGLDEGHGSWGQMGTEIACKSWLSGGRLVTNKRTWYSHLFRTQGGDFGFPYAVKYEEQEATRAYSQRLWRENNWSGQTHPLRWLVDKFWPVPGWTEEQRAALPTKLRGRAADAPAVHRGVGPSKGVCFYSDGRGDATLLNAVREQVRRSVNGHAVVSSTLAPVDLGRNIVLPLKRGILTMFKQILAGLEALDTQYAFLAEHDVLYSPDHFAFTPPRDDTYYYNLNFWKVDARTGRAVTYEAKQTSALCANRLLLVAHYQKRVERVERDGFSVKMGYEPGSHRRPERVDDVSSDTWRSVVPIIDVRHGHNLTASRWSPVEFRDQRNCRGWQEANAVPGWGATAGRFAEFLSELRK